MCYVFSGHKGAAYSTVTCGIVLNPDPFKYIVKSSFMSHGFPIKCWIILVLMATGHKEQD